MGIDFHGLNFLLYAAKRRPFGATVTIGRQNIHLPNYMLRKILNLKHDRKYGPFCEALLLDHMGASSVDSFDASDFEQASFIHDFNTPLGPHLCYDTVVDVGTLEHIFNIPIALRNVASLCNPGGQIIHVLPANNFPGHGFWQFSPELFFSLYSEANGFSDTEVLVAELDNERYWFKANIPQGGVRVGYISKSRSYVLVLTRKTTAVTGETVQQSDYIYQWQRTAVAGAGSISSAKTSRLRSTIERFGLVSTLVAPVLKAYRDKKAFFNDAFRFRLSSRNRQFRKILISSLV
jgi:SAM-dependent methyltransferase